MVGGELNGARLGRYVVDVAITFGEIKIAIEYDTWFYHGPSNRRDSSKDRALLADGWRILRVRTNNQLPTKSQLDEAIRRLMEGELWSDIVLDDWGVGPVAPWLLDDE
jgi:very-short-patch-repair endonuclease